uniref:Uncharacterized protein n=1 Tax=Anguilla anguilla TaxID=7936 RepID=A0A0E9VBQ2_ANGAN
MKRIILKDDLRYYFMNPCDKYRARRQIPWKLGVQILKIIMITTQLVLFWAEQSACGFLQGGECFWPSRTCF